MTAGDKIRPQTASAPRSNSRRVAASQVESTRVSASVVAMTPRGCPTALKRRAASSMSQRLAWPMCASAGGNVRSTTWSVNLGSSFPNRRAAAAVPSRQLLASTMTSKELGSSPRSSRSTWFANAARVSAMPASSSRAGMTTQTRSVAAGGASAAGGPTGASSPRPASGGLASRLPRVIVAGSTLRRCAARPRGSALGRTCARALACRRPHRSGRYASARTMRRARGVAWRLPAPEPDAMMRIMT